MQKFGKLKGLCAFVSAGVMLGVNASYGAFADVTSISTHNTVATASTLSSIAGYGASYSVYQPKDTYTVKYLGEDDAITSLNAGALGNFSVSSQGTTVVRRGATGGNNDTVWYVGTGNGNNKSTVTLDGPTVSSFTQAFAANNVLMGADNVFSNSGNAVGNNTNVDRIDVMFSGGLTASAAQAFAIFDRGPTNDHDTFKIAAITALSNGAPSAYGSLQTFSDGTWGKPVITPPGTGQENIIRKNNTVPGDSFHPSDLTTQSVGGVLIQTDTLATAGTKIYGYSIFSATASGSSSALVNYAGLPPANSTSTGGGLDPLATLGLLYTSTSAVPEPTTALLTGLVAATCMRGVVKSAMPELFFGLLPFDITQTFIRGITAKVMSRFFCHQHLVGIVSVCIKLTIRYHPPSMPSLCDRRYPIRRNCDEWQRRTREYKSFRKPAPRDGRSRSVVRLVQNRFGANKQLDPATSLVGRHVPFESVSHDAVVGPRPYIYLQ